MISLISLIGLIDVFALIFNEHLFDEETGVSVKCELFILLGVSICVAISYVLEVIT